MRAKSGEREWQAMQGCPFKFERNSSVVLFITVLVLVAVVVVVSSSIAAGKCVQDA